MSAVPLGELYRSEYGRVLATVIRLVGDFGVAEDAVQDAFESALRKWSEVGIPRNPRSWLISAAKFRAIDRLRRRGRLQAIGEELRRDAAREADVPDGPDDAIPDERLRLVFTCCHPALAADAQVALALRALCGLSTDEIARAFLVPRATMAQRLVRAKRKIREAGIPYEVPPPDRLAERLETVATATYLVFNEGYAATGGEQWIRADLCREAIRLARILALLLPEEPEVLGLLGLMLLHDARRGARTSASGGIVALEEQDRSLWDRGQIGEGLDCCARANAVPEPGPYALQAAIAAEHARTFAPDETDWSRIAALYADLMAIRPSPVVELNRAVAVSMADGYEAGLRLVAELKQARELERYAPLWTTEAELLRRMERYAEAQPSYRRALELVTSGPEREFLERRLEEVDRKENGKTK
jgi:RNA polymerase sigma-70 factor (ECF subfamily)